MRELDDVSEVITLAEGLRRIVNDLPPSASPRLRVNQSAFNRSPNRLSEALTEQHWI